MPTLQRFHAIGSALNDLRSFPFRKQNMFNWSFSLAVRFPLKRVDGSTKTAPSNLSHVFLTPTRYLPGE